MNTRTLRTSLVLLALGLPALTLAQGVKSQAPGKPFGTMQEATSQVNEAVEAVASDVGAVKQSTAAMKPQVEATAAGVMDVKASTAAIAPQLQSMASKVQGIKSATDAIPAKVDAVNDKVQAVQIATSAMRPTVDAVAGSMGAVQGMASRIEVEVGDIGQAIRNPRVAPGGIVLITQARALKGGLTPDDAPGFPVTLGEPGRYSLASNLEISALDADAIEIITDHVTLDLNGFAVFGPGAGSGEGIAAPPGLGGNSVVVRDGMVRDMGSNGIRLDSKSRIENVQAIFNGGDGINATSGTLVSGTIANDNGGHGIRTGSDSRLQGVEAAVNGARTGTGHGVLVGARSLVIDSVLTRNRGVGLGGSGAFAYGGNVIAGNNGGDASDQVQGGTEIRTNFCAGGTVCP